jgi:transcriptional regulator with XRE-family HTH domain
MIYENGYFKNKLSGLLELNGWNQSDFAKLTGGSPASVSHWVCGRTKPNRFIMPKVLQVLGEYAGRALTEEEVWG